MIKPFLRAETLFFLLLLLGIQVVGRSAMLRDPGCFWHMVVGERIIEQRCFTDIDSFSFTQPGAPWIAMQWLGECIMAVLYRWGGLDLLLLSASVLLALTYTLPARRFLTGGCHWLTALLLLFVTLAASSYHFHVRPHLVSITFLGITQILLIDVEKGTRRIGWLIALIPLFLLWTNLHAGVLGGWGTIVLVFAGWSSQFVIFGRGPVQSRRDLVLLIVVMVACGLTFLMNPYGIRLPRVWLSLSRSTLLPRIIEEHGPLTLDAPDMLGVWVLLVFFLVLLCSCPLSTWRVSWIVPLIWFYLGWTRIRHAPLFAITAALVIAELLRSSLLIQKLIASGSTLFVKPDPSVANNKSDWRAWVLPVMVVLLALGIQAAHWRVAVVGKDWARPHPENAPLELLPAIEQQIQDAPSGIPIFNDMGFAGFLIRYVATCRVFIDDRCELYEPTGLLLDYVKVNTKNVELFDTWEKKYGFGLALVRPRGKLTKHIVSLPHWKKVAETPHAVFFRRVGVNPNDRPLHFDRRPTSGAETP